MKNIRNIVEPNSGFELELNKYYDEHIANIAENNDNKIHNENKNEENNINEIREI